jgi:DNA-binding response OmpR family regulator
MSLSSKPSAIVQYHLDSDSLLYFRIFRKYFDLKTCHTPLCELQASEVQGAADLLILLSFSGFKDEAFEHILRLRRDCIPVPVLVVGSGNAFERNACLNAEVYEYLSAHDTPLELASRVELLSRRLRTIANSNQIEISSRVKIDTKFQQVIVDGKAIFLSPLEYKIFVALSEIRDRELSREEIVDRVWGPGFAMNSRSVDSHISRLRSKVQPIGLDVEVKRGSGYFLKIHS